MSPCMNSGSPRIFSWPASRQGGLFEAAVELDALEALHPGELARLVRERILRAGPCVPRREPGGGCGPFTLPNPRPRRETRNRPVHNLQHNGLYPSGVRPPAATRPAITRPWAARSPPSPGSVVVPTPALSTCCACSDGGGRDRGRPPGRSKTCPGGGRPSGPQL